MLLPVGTYEVRFTPENGYFLVHVNGGEDLIIYNPYPDKLAAIQHLSKITQPYTQFKFGLTGIQP